MTRWVYTFRTADGALMRIGGLPRASAIVTSSQAGAIQQARRLAQDHGPITVLRSRVSDPYIGNGQPFDEAEPIKTVLP